MIKKLLFFTGSVFLTNLSFAELDKQKATEQMQKLIPDAEITRIKATPIKEIYEVNVDSNVFYMDGSTDYVFYGHMLNLKEDEPKSLTEESQAEINKQILEKVPDDYFVKFKAKNAKHEIIVFTDIDCAYCRKLHQEVPELNAAGITVKYLAFPRAGVDSDSFNKAVAVWCSKDQQQAMTIAKQGKEIKIPGNCNKKVEIENQLQLVNKLNLRATPVIFLEDGKQIPGYMPAKNLIAKIIN